MAVEHLRRISLPTLAERHKDLRDALINHCTTFALAATEHQYVQVGNMLWNNSLAADHVMPTLDPSVSNWLFLPNTHQADESLIAGFVGTAVHTIDGTHILREVV